MTPTSDGFTVALDLPDGQHLYQFLLQGGDGSKVWVLDSSDPVYRPDGNGNVHHLLELRGGVPIDLRPRAEKFEWRNPAALKVMLAGDFNQWSPYNVPFRLDDDGVWRCYLIVARPITYKVVVDGLWLAEEQDPERGIQHLPDGFGMVNTIRTALSLGDPEAYLADQPPGMALLAELDLATVQTEAEVLDRARMLAHEGDYARAIALTRVASRMTGQPRSVESLREEAAIERRFGLNDNAAAVWESIVATFPPDESSMPAYHELATFYIFARNDSPAARELFSRMLDATSDPRTRASILADVGRSYLREQKWAEATQAFEAALTTAPVPDPANPNPGLDYFWCDMHNGTAEAYMGLGMLDKAREHFMRAVRVNSRPDAANAQYARQWLAQLGRPAASAPEQLQMDWSDIPDDLELPAPIRHNAPTYSPFAATEVPTQETPAQP